MDDIFAEAAQRESQLHEQLAASPIVDVKGIVHASGVGGVQTRAETQWTLLITLVAWRVGYGSLRTDSVTIRRKVNHDELKSFQELIKPDTVVAIRARIAEQNVFGIPQGLLEELIGIDSSDTELHEYLTELLKPVTYRDEFFGLFTFERDVTTYATKALWNGTAVELRLWLDDRAELDAALKAAYELWDESLGWDQQIKDCIARDLLPLKGENWREADGSLVSREGFECRMTLASITVRADGTFDVRYDDGDLFWGHSIVVYGSLKGGVKGASLEG